MTVPEDHSNAKDSRAQRLAVKLREQKVDWLLVTSPVNLRYLTGFTGSNGMALIAVSPQLQNRFFTDFRYDTQSSEQVDQEFEREIVPADLLQAATNFLGSNQAAAQTQTGRLGFDDANLTVKQHARLRDLLPDAWQLVGCAGIVERLREVKDASELARIASAAELADEALKKVLQHSVVGRTELDVSIELEMQMRKLGANAPSFPSIVAAGEHSALPHAQPRDVEIPRGVLLTIDWGALHEGYCSDCTRTFATGELSGEAKEIYQLVAHAQAASRDAVRPGISGVEVDRLAREIIEQAGHGERFGHGLGHGVGMEIHEAPRLSRTAGEQQLQAGNVVTIEPGIYLPGRFGVRIEDLVIVTEQGSHGLSSLPKELEVLS